MCEVPDERGHQRHELRLQVGREAREGIGDDIDRLDAAAVALDADAVVRSSVTSAPARRRLSSAVSSSGMSVFSSTTSPPVMATAMA